MPKHNPGPVRRWVDEAPGSGLDAHLGEVFRAVPDEAPLSSSELASVRWRITQARQSGARGGKLRYLPLLLASLIAGGSVAFAGWTPPGFWRLHAPRAIGEATDVGTTTDVGAANAVKADGKEQISRDEPSTDALGAPADRPLGADVDAVNDSRARPVDHVPHRGATGAPAPMPQPSPLVAESELLQKALTQLRRDHDARAALVSLDDYRARFPHGLLSIEASVARVDALLLVGRRDDALAVLALLPLEHTGRALELQLLRAELYAERDCSQALRHFDAVLAASVASGLEERALYGRARCRLQLGNVADGRADLQSYLARYPRGRFADHVRARLAAP